MTDHTTTRGRAGRLRERLSDRDLEVLKTLYQLRLATSRHLQRLHVPDGSARTRTRRTRALLQRLSDLRLVVRMARTVGGTRSGSSAHIYGLSGLGLAVLNVQGPYGRRRRRVWETKPHFARHVLAVTELAVSLTERSRPSAVDLVTFDGEPACWRPYPGPMGVPITLKPDAYVHVGVGEFERHALIEMDMATESLPSVRRKCASVIHYFNSGVEQGRRGIFPVVLWLVPSEHRQRQLEEVIADLETEYRHLFTVALQEDGPALLTAPVEVEA
ncbi:replication-relaxation family protein [Amycolatopsis sp. CB00013]|uniref:replication-relaxation family protein n=1 Tax=Amycolatopsis sp. CB00013 TaxID=1703945 RepID=UPI0009402213|nr:replication-relaxation family protein [Amycolatopsis sp. CB00013]OKJ97413.1 hypothetical protein AMK34_10435 [Amycolatopsis sp. CB00013]